MKREIEDIIAEAIDMIQYLSKLEDLAGQKLIDILEKMRQDGEPMTSEPFIKYYNLAQSFFSQAKRTYKIAEEMDTRFLNDTI